MCAVLLLDNERWKQAEVPAEFQDLVDSIADGRITLPDRKHTGSKPSFTVTVYLALINGFSGIQIFFFFFFHKLLLYKNNNNNNNIIK